MIKTATREEITTRVIEIVRQDLADALRSFDANKCHFDERTGTLTIHRLCQAAIDVAVVRIVR
jgi:hypothetical protein